MKIDMLAFPITHTHTGWRRVCSGSFHPAAAFCGQTASRITPYMLGYKQSMVTINTPDDSQDSLALPFFLRTARPQPTSDASLLENPSLPESGRQQFVTCDAELAVELAIDTPIFISTALFTQLHGHRFYCLTDLAGLPFC